MHWTGGSDRTRTAGCWRRWCSAYVDTAEPAGSQALARGSGLGVSPATIRNTMSDLEEKGYLYHPHTSAGRIPTDLRVSHLRGRRGAARARRPRRSRSVLRLELHAAVHGERAGDDPPSRGAGAGRADPGARRGGGAGPRAVAARAARARAGGLDRLLLVFTLRSGVVRTIFVQVPSTLPPERGAAGGPDPERAARGPHARARSAAPCASACATWAGRTRTASCSTSSSPRATSCSTCRRAGAGRDARQREPARRPAGVRRQQRAHARPARRSPSERDLLAAALGERAAPRPDHHDRRREPRSATGRVHAGHVVLPRSAT